MTMEEEPIRQDISIKFGKLENRYMMVADLANWRNFFKSQGDACHGI